MNLDPNYYIVELDIEGTITDGRVAPSPDEAERVSKSEAEDLLVSAIERNFSRTDLDVDIEISVTDVTEDEVGF